jgi:hypothetical protein
MALTQSQRAIIEKARALGGGQQAIALDDEICAYLTAVIILDLQLTAKFPEIPKNLPHFFGSSPLKTLRLPDRDFLKLFERLVKIDPNSDTYFSCLAALHKGRLKYERILETQPIPTMDQIGPRGLLQYGSVSPKALTGFLFWRKWMYDIDNRAAQETGYLFEPIIAYAIGGVPASAKKSPVRRQRDSTKGRQVDCIRQKKAYEIKLRVTIAASGQGRWAEEIEFPADCRASGYTPVLVVFDPTPNPKLDELRRMYLSNRGEVYIGKDAWEHLEKTAGATMAKFIQRYVHDPIQALLAEVPEQLPELSLKMEDSEIIVAIAGDSLRIARAPETAEELLEDMPDDADDPIPGPS